MDAPWSFTVRPVAGLRGVYEAEVIDQGKPTRIKMSKDAAVAYLGRLMGATERTDGHAARVAAEADRTEP